jgi:predicted nucleotidyltransferase
VRLEGLGIDSPKALYLYGSRAKGTCHPDSDVDVFAVLPSGPVDASKQDELDQWTEQEVMEGEISEGPQELDINVTATEPPAGAISFTQLRKTIRDCKKLDLLSD